VAGAKLRDLLAVLFDSVEHLICSALYLAGKHFMQLFPLAFVRNDADA
jgi:hypothetical protein